MKKKKSNTSECKRSMNWNAEICSQGHKQNLMCAEKK
jgi:hypothetical protein